jgi:hypothetical protein
MRLGGCRLDHRFAGCQAATQHREPHENGPSHEIGQNVERSPPEGRRHIPAECHADEPLRLH